MSSAYIKVQSVTGTWITVDTCMNNDNVVKAALDSAEQKYKNKKIKAVDQKGRVLDFRN